MSSYVDAPNKAVVAGDGVRYAYRDCGAAPAVPLVLLQHFRGNLDNWDPALVDALSAHRRVITVDYPGLGGSSGEPAETIEQMARQCISFASALSLETVDLLGFSIGSFVAQSVTLLRPSLVRRLVLASAAPEGAAGMHGWAAGVMEKIGTKKTTPEKYLDVFFAPTEVSREAGWSALARMTARTEERDATTSWAARNAQYDAVTRWGIPNHALLQRLASIEQPVFVANGDSDPMILPRYSHLVAGLVPDARIKIYPDAAHGFLFQHHDEFAADVAEFLDN